jgi:hypothetical protein
MDPSDAMARFAPALPAGVAVTSIAPVPLNAPALQAELRWAEYVVTVETGEAPEQIEQKVQTFLAASTLPRERRGKSYNLRPLALSLMVEAARDSSARIAMRLLADASAGTGRPDEVLAALGWGDAPTQIHRRKLGFSNDE